MAPRFDVESHVVLFSEATVKLNAERVQPGQLEDLRNPNKQAMLVDEIRFDVGGNGFWPNSLPMVDFRLGRHALTHGAVPIFMLGRRDAMSASELVWRPPRPIYVPQDMILTPRFAHRRLQGGGTRDFKITYIGRSLSPSSEIPSTITLPWVAAYIPSAYPEDGKDQEIKSTANDLVNSTSEDVQIDYLLTNAYLNGSASYAGRVRGYQNTTVRVSDRLQKPIVREPVPMLSVFSLIDGVWDMSMILKPSDFLVLEVTTAYSPHTDDFDQLLFSMVGHREVTL
jgi:hypothetical protein